MVRHHAGPQHMARVPVVWVGDFADPVHRTRQPGRPGNASPLNRTNIDVRLYSKGRLLSSGRSTRYPWTSENLSLATIAGSVASIDLEPVELRPNVRPAATS